MRGRIADMGFRFQSWVLVRRLVGEIRREREMRWDLGFGEWLGVFLISVCVVESGVEMYT